MGNKHGKKYDLYGTRPLTEKQIREFTEEEWDNSDFWSRIVTHSTLSEEFIREYKDKFDMIYVVYYQKVSKEFVREIMDDSSALFWRNLSSSKNINNTYFDEFKHKIHWTNILDDRVDAITVGEIEKYFYDILTYVTGIKAYDWEIASLSKYPHLTEQFIEKHSDWLDWGFISYYQILSEKFIEQHKDKIDWECISSSQKLSEKFILKYKDKLDWWKLTKNANLAPYIRKKVASGYYHFEIGGKHEHKHKYR